MSQSWAEAARAIQAREFEGGTVVLPDGTHRRIVTVQAGGPVSQVAAIVSSARRPKGGK